MVIYLIKCLVTEKVYVGQTIGSHERRWKRHVFDAHRGVRTHLANAIRKHGADNFEVSLLQTCNTTEELNRAETRWIEHFDSFRSGYNSTLGGDGLAGWRHSAETREKMSRSQAGRIVSQEAREKLSRAFKGRKRTPEAVKKQFETRKGYSHSDETREKIASGVSKYSHVGPVFAFTETGEFVQEFKTVNEAAQHVSGKICHIWNVITGQRKTHKDLIWKLER